MFNKQKLKEMFNFTTNKKQTIKRTIYEIIQIAPAFVYQVVLTQIIDNYIPNKNVKIAVIISFGYILYIWLRIFLCNFYLEKQRNIVCFDNDRQIKSKIFNNIQKVNVSTLDKIQVGKLFSITTSQSFEASRLFIWNFLGLFAYRIKSILVTFIIMLFIDWQIAFSVLGIFVVSYLILIPFYNKNKKIYEDLQKTIINLQGKINEYIDSFSTTKTLRLEEINIEDIKKLLEKAKCNSIKSSKILNIHSTIFSLLSFFATIVTLLISGNKIIIGIGVGSSIILMLDYINDINGHMKGVLDHAHEAINKYTAFLNVLEVMKLDKEVDEGTLELNKIDSIEFKDVALSYDGVNVILENINLKVDEPKTIAIVGKSGAGKTSFVNLIPRFYNITNGQILINGIDYTKYKLNELRKNISYVFQEPVILNMSIKDNLMYGNEGVTFEKVIELCEKIGIHEKIGKFENGYDTVITAETDLLSYGEKQLLSFARAILKNGDIVILDEVTSNLDLEFEQYIMKATKEILNKKISFVIAHRLNTIKNADLIVFIENKNIVEMGTHDELIAKQGYYYNLYMSKEENKKILIKT